jgi:hypothetical protein
MLKFVTPIGRKELVSTVLIRVKTLRKWILSPSAKVSRTLPHCSFLVRAPHALILHGYFYDIAVKSRPILAATFTVALGAFLYAASHTIAEGSANAASHQTPAQQQPKPAPPKPIEPAPQHLKPKSEVRQEEHKSDHARHNELCRKLEQRRAELREEEKRNKQQNPQ